MEMMKNHSLGYGNDENSQPEAMEILRIQENAEKAKKERRKKENIFHVMFATDYFAMRKT